jgi:hypothetical protein
MKHFTYAAFIGAALITLSTTNGFAQPASDGAFARQANQTHQPFAFTAAAHSKMRVADARNGRSNSNDSDSDRAKAFFSSDAPPNPNNAGILSGG